MVDGKLSQTCYLKALDSCYVRLSEKYVCSYISIHPVTSWKKLFISLFISVFLTSTWMDRFEKAEGRSFSLADTDYIVCHSPYNKVTLTPLSLSLSTYMLIYCLYIYKICFYFFPDILSACAKKLWPYNLQRFLAECKVCVFLNRSFMF